jgi:ATP-dependent helicase HrpB
VNPPDLPVLDALPALHAALAAGRNAILIAPPGAGKTTLVPPALLPTTWRGTSRILMLEPRRLAARAAAARMAALCNEPVGQTIGYRTRLDSAVSPATLVEVVTEGLLIRRLLSDPGLDGTAAVILDEVHERSLEADLALALCLDLQRQLRPELRLIAMSATAEGARLAALMDAEVIESHGRLHPLTIHHARHDMPHPRDLPTAIAATIRAALKNHPGDILAFLPGMAEIRRTESALADCGAAVLPLHGELPPAAQDLALRPAETRRIVLATSIAETSLTVPGIRIVIDGGFRRAPVFDPGSGLTRLTTTRISRAAADQRAGRAGREGPGVAIRLWTQALHRGLQTFDRPEILSAELSGLLLDCTAWGTSPPDLPFLDPPPRGALAAASSLLRDLGALDRDNRITELGRRMARLGAHPRLAAMMLTAATPAEQATAADLAAILEERDPLSGPQHPIAEKRGTRSAHASTRESGAQTQPPADITLRLLALSEPNRAAISRIRRAATQYRRRLGAPANAPAEADPAPLIAAAFPDRIAQRRGEPGSFRLAGGGGASLPRTDRLATVPLLAIAALDMKTSPRVRLAAPLDPAVLYPRATEHTETALDSVTGSVLVRRRIRFGALILSDRTEPAEPAEAAPLLAQAALGNGMRALPWTETARQLQARVALMRQLEPDAGWPDLSDETLAATPDTWLTPHLHGATRLAGLASLDLTAILRATLPGDLAARLDRELPTHLPLPAGRAPIDYTQPAPTASARAQAFFGMSETPRLASGRVILSLCLLSPAGRPVAVTSDLGNFWTRGWADVRRDRRGRYPRHPWPENPILPPPMTSG